MEHRVILLEHEVKTLGQKMHALHDTVYGNGHVGLKTEVDRLQQRGLRKQEAIGLWLSVVSSLVAAAAALASWIK